MHKTVVGMSIVAGIVAISGVVRGTAGVSNVLQTLDQLWLIQDGESINTFNKNVSEGILTVSSLSTVPHSVGNPAVIQASQTRMDSGDPNQTTSDGIWIPRGALRDKSIMFDDIDRSGVVLDTPLVCPE